jgi:4-hydroxythreonine-4-phosphate dehydrogenase
MNAKDGRMENGKPRLAVTMGDPAGIGPEIIIKAITAGEILSIADLLVIGDARVFQRAAGFPGLKDPKFRVIHSIEEDTGGWGGGPLLLDLANASPSDCPVGEISPAAGKAAVAAVQSAAHLAMAGVVDGMVTAPLNKAAMHAAGYPYQGHTELLKGVTGAERVSMLLTGPKLRVIHVSTHIPLRQAVAGLDPARVFEVIWLGYGVMNALGVSSPKIAVAGLNPHAGEGGLFGDEEARLLAPAILRAREAGIDVSDPQPPDTVFLRAIQGAYDLVVAMYHDQGHIPMKLLAFDEGVNVSVGLPIIRTSVDHGTAFDIAGKGTASPVSLAAAVEMAVRLSEGEFTSFVSSGLS